MKAAITIDEWKLSIFKRVLKKAGYKFKVQPKPMVPGVLVIMAEYTDLDRMNKTVRDAQRQCIAAMYMGTNTRH